MRSPVVGFRAGSGCGLRESVIILSGAGDNPSIIHRPFPEIDR